MSEATAVIMLALTGIAAWAVLGPYQGGRAALLDRLGDPLEDARRQALRHLRDLDEDRAHGKLDEEGYRASRAVAETHAVAVLRSLEAREHNGELPAAMREVREQSPVTAATAPASDRRWQRVAIAGTATAVVVAGAIVLLAGAASNRSGGQNITGGAVDQGAQAGTQLPLESLEQRVKDHPNDVAARLDLGQRYQAAGKLGEATREYLAAVKLEPDNPEANTSLGLLLFQSGLAEQGLQSVDKALASDPHYPEALYAKGLILFMGLRQPDSAATAFRAYLAAAPFGAHRDTAERLLRLTSAEGVP